MNRKIKNAKKFEINGITFKSSLEARIYKALLDAEIKPEYEGWSAQLSPQMRAGIPFFNNTGKKGFHLVTEPISGIQYTPDFVFNYHGVKVIIEVKGYENDVFYLKKNLFRKLLEESQTVKYMFFEVRSVRELKKALEEVVKCSSLLGIWKFLPELPTKDYAKAAKLLHEGNLKGLKRLALKDRNENPVMLLGLIKTIEEYERKS